MPSRLFKNTWTKKTKAAIYKRFSNKNPKSNQVWDFLNTIIMKELNDLLFQIENAIPYWEKQNTTISQASVGWQLDHSLLVINGIISQLSKSNPDHYHWRFNLNRTYIQWRNSIPRGKAKAPKQVRPSELITEQELKNKLALAKQNVTLLDKLSKNSYFTHPYFGDLNLKATIWFLRLHTNHHLKIVNDIINQG
jgi:hypothetical protein